MEFRETLLAAQRNQQQKSSDNVYYKARFDPPKKEREQKPKDRLSANIQKFLAKKEEEERQKKLEAQRKRDELTAMRDPKALRKIQKTLKVIKSANKSVIEDAVDREHTAVTREGPSQPDEDDYGYESQEAAAIYQKMMEKYSKMPEEPKFPVAGGKSKKDLESTKERVKHALQHDDEPVPHKRRRRTEHDDRDPSPPPKLESEKKREEKEKPKFRKPLPPPMDFNQLLKLAEQKKCEPIEVLAPKKAPSEAEPERLMTKKQKKEYEEEMARRARRQERLNAEKNGAPRREAPKEERSAPAQSERRPESSSMSFGRIPKIGDKNSSSNDKPRNDSPKTSIKTDKDKIASERDKIERLQKERERLKQEKERVDKEIIDRERLAKLKAERERIERDIERLNKDRDRLEKTKIKLESTSKTAEKPRLNKEQDQKKIDLKSQNTYRIDKNSNERKIPVKNTNGHAVNGKQVPKDRALVAKQGESSKVNGVKSENCRKLDGKIPMKRPDERKDGKAKPVSNSFDFDKHVSSLGRKPEGKPVDRKKMHPDHVKRKQQMAMKRRCLNSDSEYDSEMDDFIDDGDAEVDYSKHIKEIFGYDKSKFRDIDDDDDPSMVSSFSQQMREEYITKKIGILEDLEDMKLEKQMKKKKRRISDD